MTSSYPMPSARKYGSLPFAEKLMWIRRLDAMEPVIGKRHDGHDVSDIRKAWAETERPKGKRR